MDKFIILDLDDTLCDISHRRKYYKKDWITYYRLIPDDKLNKEVYDRVVNDYNKYHCGIIILTGRLKHSEKVTKAWLSEYFKLPYTYIDKPEGDFRSSVEFKKLWLGNNKDRILEVIDDRKEIADFCESNNIVYINPGTIGKSEIYKLRKITGKGLYSCKLALENNNYDMEKAINTLITERVVI